MGIWMFAAMARALGFHGTVAHETRNMRTALSLLRRDGIVIIRNALHPAEIGRVSAAALEFMRDIRVRLDAGSDFSDIDKKLNFNATTFACDLVAIDPETAAEPNNLQLERTALFRAIMKGPLPPLLRGILTDKASWQMARLRVVFADRARIESGALDFHQEQIVTKFPGVYNIWTTLTPPGTVANRDTPGVQFYLGRREKLRTLRIGSPEYEALIEHLNQAAQAGEPGDAEGTFFRPQLSLGDVVLFDSYVPHASYIPPAAQSTRVSFDIRLFPTPDDRGPKPFPISQ